MDCPSISGEGRFFRVFPINQFEYRYRSASGVDEGAEGVRWSTRPRGAWLNRYVPPDGLFLAARTIRCTTILGP
jgi:hypothetical protein